MLLACLHALRWNHIINNKLFMNTTASFTRYRFDMKLGTSSEVTRKNPDSYTFNEMALGYKSGIVDYGIKRDFDFSPHPNQAPQLLSQDHLLLLIN